MAGTSDQKNQDNIPAELRSLKQWVIARVEPDPTPSDPDRKSKHPRSPHTGDLCSVYEEGFDPQALGTFDEAVAAREKFSCQFVGFCFMGSEYRGLDFDKTRHKRNALPNGDHLDVMKAADSFTELSQSHRGYHVIVRAPGTEDPDAKAKRVFKLKAEDADTEPSAIEIFYEGFFVFTGNVSDAKPIRSLSPAEFSKLVALAESKKSRDTDVADGKPFCPMGPTKLKEVTAGNWRQYYPSPSDAMTPLLSALLVESACDAEAAEATFKNSVFFATTRWKTKWDRLRDREIARAMPSAREWLKKIAATSRRKSSGPEETVQIDLTPLRDVAKEHLRYLWSRYLPIGKLVTGAGNSSQGKSPVIVVDWVSRLTAGLSWPDGSENTAGPRSVIVLAAEDDAADTLRPRIELAGGNLEKILLARCSVTKEHSKAERMLALDRDIEALVGQARSVPDLAMIVIDPITNYLGKLRMNREEDVRQALMPLAELARELKIVIVVICHFNRRERGTDPFHRIMGAAAFGGISRFIYLFGPDPEDADKYAHVMVQLRGVGAPTLRYKTEMVVQEWDGEKSEVLRVVWRGESSATEEDVVDPTAPSEKSKNSKAARLLREFLKEGKQPSQSCLAYLKTEGFEGLNTTRLLEAAGARSEKFEGQSHYDWFLPDTVTDQMF